MTIKDLEVDDFDFDNSKNQYVNIWKLASGKEESNIPIKSWQHFVKENYVGFGWFDLQTDLNMDYRDFNSPNEIKNKLIEDNPNKDKNFTAIASMIWNFTNEIEIGDIVVVNHGFDKVFGIGIVTSDYIPPNGSDINNGYLLDHKKNG